MTQYVDPKAIADQKMRISEQVDAVRDKLTKWADKVVVGQYTGKKEPDREEGETWVDDYGKTWTVKNGIKQSLRKTAGASTPFWCPRCGRGMNHKIHDKFYWLRGACHDCVVKYEGKMRRGEVWPAYERRIMRNNEKAWIRDKISAHLDYIRTFREPQLHFQDGRWETFVGKKHFEESFDKLRKDVAFLESRLIQIQKEEHEDAVEQRKLTEWEQENPW